jgi:WD40 repeat protein
MLLTASDDTTVKVWDLGTGEVVRTLRGHEGYVYSADWSPDGRTIASVGRDDILRIWRNDEEPQVIEIGNARQTLAFSPDGELLATAGFGKTIGIYDSSTGDELRTLSGHENVVRSLIFSPDGRRLFSAGGDGIVKIWSTSDWVEILAIQGPERAIYDLAIDSEGQRLAAACSDGTVRIWNAHDR